MQDDVEERTARSIIRDFEGYGYTKKEIMALADEVAAKGRDGDELLAYLSPESVELLKERGGSGTINPATGLPEFAMNDASIARIRRQAAMDLEFEDGDIQTRIDEKAFADARAAADAKAASDAQAAADARAAADKAATAKAMLDKIPVGKVAVPSPVTAAPVSSGPPPPPSGDLKDDSIGHFGIDEYGRRSGDPDFGKPSTTLPKMSDGPGYTPVATPPVLTATPPSALLLDPRRTTPPVMLPPVATLPVMPPPGVVMPPPATPPVATPQPRKPVLVMPPRTPYTSPAPGTTRPAITPRANIPISVPTMPAYSSRGVGAVGTANAATNKNNFFALTPQTSTGLAPGSVAIGPASMPIAAARKTLSAISANPNLSPGMLGGQQNAGVMVDRLGNRIFAPSPPPVMRTFAKGGDVDVGALLAQNTETLSDEEPEEVINNDPVGTAQKFLSDLNSAGKASPTRQAIKRVKTSPGGGATADKAMQLAYEDLAKGDLGVMKDRPPAARNTESARSQMEELARIYQIKIRSAQESAKGLSANTFGAPTLEGATLTKGKLTKKRFKDGGEAKKSDVVGDIGKWLKNNDINPSDFLAALGRVGSVAGAALTPSTLNAGEDAELARRRTMPPTVTRAEGSPAEGERAPELTGVNRVVDSIAQRLPADSFPTAARTLLETVQGKKEPITESNFSPKELSVLRQLIESTGGRGNVQYDDYTKFMRQQQQKKGTIPGSITPGPLSIIDPIGNVQTTLGRFAYARDAEGNLVINDKYDFNPIRPMSGAYGALRNYAGEKIPPGKGREVRINLGKSVNRAEGSPPEGEESLDQYYAPKARPSTGLNRKKGPISQALDSGDAYVNVAKGLTEMPYNLAGGPMDLVMLARQALTGDAPAGQVGTSDYIKRKMTELGIRPEPPADPTAKGFYTAGDLLSNLVNPAGVTRTGVKVAQKTGQAVGDAAKTLEDLTVGEVQRARVRKAGRKAQDIPDTAYDPLRERLEATGNLAYVVKKSGGNWVPGTVENALIPLKTPLVAGKAPVERLSSHEALLKDPSLNQDQLDRVQYHLGIVKGEVALDNWVDTNLTNYVKKQMGTPEDPVRKLAEEGITHLPQENNPDDLGLYVAVTARREKAGFPGDEVGTSPQAQLWEYRADEAIRPRQMGETIREHYPGGMTMRQLFTSEPGGGWAAKVPGTEMVNELRSPGTSSVAKIAPRLGFDHIMDVLREEVTTGRIRPEQLSKVSMADAVRLTYQYDQKLAAKMTAARIATRQGLPVYKEYPKNYRWIQLNKPGSFAQESDAMGHSVRGYEPPVGHPDWVAGSGNSGSRSYGHGGWEAIKSGEAKVYSLVDAKGEPHTTIEVAKGKHPIGYSFARGRSNATSYTGFPETFEYNNENSVTGIRNQILPPINPEQRQLILNRAKELYRERDISTTPTMNTMDAFQKAADEVIGELPGEITQIKGKQNAAPKEEYLPFVQDFVKSGNWLDVQDLRNTRLLKIDADSEMAASFKEIGKPAPTYVTQDELTKLTTWRRAGGALNLLPEGFARGGAVLRRYNKGGPVDKNTAFIKAHS